jgi:cytosine deaminase
VLAAGAALGLDVEVVALASVETDPATPEGARLLADAVEAGATHLGGVPWLYRDPVASIDATLDLARTLGVPVDVHLDETLDPSRFHLDRLAEATIEHGFEGRVTAGHCCALAAVGRADAEQAIQKVAAAGITIVALPALNLYLQDRGGSPRLCGITLVRDLLDAGVPVRFGSDNVRDVFLRRR